MCDRVQALYNNPLGYILLFVVNPIGIVILVNYIRTIPIELDEAAAIEGCGYLRCVLSIVLPLAAGRLVPCAVHQPDDFLAHQRVLRRLTVGVLGG